MQALGLSASGVRNYRVSVGVQLDNEGDVCREYRNATEIQ